jgi:hypothetical protein
MLKHVTDVQEVVDFIFPSPVLPNPILCLRRLILAPTHCQVDMYNDNILLLIHGDQHTYMVADFLKEVNAAGMVSPSTTIDYISKKQVSFIVLDSFSSCCCLVFILPEYRAW